MGGGAAGGGAALRSCRAVGRLGHELEQVDGFECGFECDRQQAGASHMYMCVCVWHAHRSAQFIQESVATLRRRVRGQPEPLWLEGSKLYPQYYTNTFHFQTDGWFSAQ